MDSRHVFSKKKKKVKWARFEPIVSDFGASKVTKCLEGDVHFPTSSVPIFSPGTVTELVEPVLVL